MKRRWRVVLLPSKNPQDRGQAAGQSVPPPSAFAVAIACSAGWHAYSHRPRFPQTAACLLRHPPGLGTGPDRPWTGAAKLERRTGAAAPMSVAATRLNFFMDVLPVRTMAGVRVRLKHPGVLPFGAYLLLVPTIHPPEKGNARPRGSSKARHRTAWSRPRICGSEKGQ